MIVVIVRCRKVLLDWFVTYLRYEATFTFQFKEIKYASYFSFIFSTLRHLEIYSRKDYIAVLCPSNRTGHIKPPTDFRETETNKLPLPKLVILHLVCRFLEVFFWFW